MNPQIQGGDPLQEAMARRQGQGGQPPMQGQPPMPSQAPIAAPIQPMPPAQEASPAMPIGDQSEALKIIDALNGRLKAISKIQEMQINPLPNGGG